MKAFTHKMSISKNDACVKDTVYYGYVDLCKVFKLKKSKAREPPKCQKMLLLTSVLPLTPIRPSAIAMAAPRQGAAMNSGSATIKNQHFPN